MTLSDATRLTDRQREMIEVWRRHCEAEFATGSLDDAMATMTAEPHVIHVPVLTGGAGAEGLRRFYGTFFIPGQPTRTELELISRTVGESTIVDELMHKFTHDAPMPWILPGVAPTGRRIELPVVAIIQFEGLRIKSEHIYWDQASLLVQLGLLDAGKLPIATTSAAELLREPSRRMNEVIERCTTG